MSRAPSARACSIRPLKLGLFMQGAISVKKACPSTGRWPKPDRRPSVLLYNRTIPRGSRPMTPNGRLSISSGVSLSICAARLGVEKLGSSVTGVVLSRP